LKIRSLTPQHAAGIALAVAVQLARIYSALLHCGQIFALAFAFRFFSFLRSGHGGDMLKISPNEKCRRSLLSTFSRQKSWHRSKNEAILGLFPYKTGRLLWPALPSRSSAPGPFLLPFALSLLPCAFGLSQ